MTDSEKANKIKDHTIDVGTSMLKALKRMDKNESKLLIINEADKFKSLLSIGDVQRAIINNQKFEISVGEILRNDIKYCTSEDSFSDVKERMLKYRSEFMPILDMKNDLQDVIFWDELFEESHSYHTRDLNLPIVIMAGGRGSRLKPITNIIPKPLVPIGEKPILQIIVDSFVEMGADEFFFSVNYKADFIKYYFDQIPNKEYSIHYFMEEKPLGTAGSLHLLKEKINSTFFVSNCDILINQDYGEIYKYHIENKNELTLVVALKHYSIPYGTVEVNKNGLLKEIQEKPELTFMVNAGLYILEPHLINEIPSNDFFHITHLMEKIKNRKGRIGVFPVSEGAWTDIGEWKEYSKTQKIFSE